MKSSAPTTVKALLRCAVLILLTSPELTVFCREVEQGTMSGKVTKKFVIGPRSSLPCSKGALQTVPQTACATNNQCLENSGLTITVLVHWGALGLGTASCWSASHGLEIGSSLAWERHHGQMPCTNLMQGHRRSLKRPGRWAVFASAIISATILATILTSQVIKRPSKPSR